MNVRKLTTLCSFSIFLSTVAVSHTLDIENKTNNLTLVFGTITLDSKSDPYHYAIPASGSVNLSFTEKGSEFIADKYEITGTYKKKLSLYKNKAEKPQDTAEYDDYKDGLKIGQTGKKIVFVAD